MSTLHSHVQTRQPYTPMFRRDNLTLPCSGETTLHSHVQARQPYTPTFRRDNLTLPRSGETTLHSHVLSTFKIPISEYDNIYVYDRIIKQKSYIVSVICWMKTKNSRTILRPTFSGRCTFRELETNSQRYMMKLVKSVRDRRRKLCK